MTASPEATSHGSGRAGSVAIPFDNTYARLPDRFYARHAPTPVARPRLIKINSALAEDLGIDPGALATSEGLEILAGNRIPEGADPLAQAYAGHQFANFVPQLGDGRAILLGEVVDRHGVRRDIQLKGSGPTPFSRRGDGRAAIGPVLREYLVSEAFAALGIPSTRALAAVTTGEMVARETMLPGAVLTRIASSHIRVGTFQFFAARRDDLAIKLLADYVIERHYPEAAGKPNRYRALLDDVIARQASLIARWMGVGFIHGVMNTDNMSVAGETIDFGPCAFMDFYDPGQVYSSIDHRGRYAYGNQPAIAGWNLARLAETLIPLLGDDKDAAVAEGQSALDGYKPRFDTAYRDVLAAKLGFASAQDGDAEIAAGLLDRMAATGADFTGTWRLLNDIAAEEQRPEAAERAQIRLASIFPDADTFTGWLGRWRARLAADGASPSHASPAERADRMRRANPLYIPRNHLIEEVIKAAVENADLAPFEKLRAVLSAPFDELPGHDRYALPPGPTEVVHQTFCGT